MIHRSRLSLGQSLLHQHIDYAAVLRMHAHQRAILRSLLQRAKDGRVVHHQHIGIRHEQLKARHALANHIVHVFEARCARQLSQVRHNHVQPVIDARLALGLPPPRIQRRAHLRSARLYGEVHNRRRPANRSRARARLKIIGRVSPSERHVQMSMRIHAARKHQQPRGIDNRVPIGRNPRANLANSAALNQHVRGKRGHCSNNGSVLNQQSHYRFTV